MKQELLIWWIVFKYNFNYWRDTVRQFVKTEQAKVVGFYGGMVPAVCVWLWLCVEHIYLSAGG